MPEMTNLDKLLKDFKEARSAATEGEWENLGDIYIFANQTMVADTNDDDAVLRARGVGGGMTLEQQVANLNLCVLAANNSAKLIRIIEMLIEEIVEYSDLNHAPKLDEALQQAEKIAGET